MADSYWPDLSLLPEGWRIVAISWGAGRATVRLLRLRDNRAVETSGNHHTPNGAFRAAVLLAQAEA